MSVLLVRLAGPLQSWGSASRFARRTTENVPTKSGVVGLLAAALGRSRQADLTDLVALGFGVRADQPGTRLKDFQTARHLDTGKAMPVSERFYLADAVFVAGLESDDHRFLGELYEALLTPRFLPYLGRRSCPPSRPLDMGPPLRDTTLREALSGAPWQASAWYRRQRTGRASQGAEELALHLDCPPSERPDHTLRDLPVSYDPRHRRYGLRGVRSEQVPPPVPVRGSGAPEHDPVAALAGAAPVERPAQHDQEPRKEP
ncbi:type I-E CRISPR-associated protein Cas5/CasD [Streptomyces sp. NPDC049906]|uniref:type I-E CRISPR-associated protein Cas5/CasD n=1 Tax=Streptomyces sp. NPDC049906 TaxID=3155656 RepID=UPI003442AE5B